MKRLPLVLAAALLGTPLGAQSPATTAVAPLSTLRSAEELEQLLAPIALYPDALIALILPATTAPTDIVLAARQMRETPGDRSQVEHRAWDESVKSLTNYVEVLLWLDENLQWTRQVGEAFALQPAEVMQAVQRLRARARAAGTLVDTPQQQVITETEVIRIVPAQPDVIYVPHYAPEIVFVESSAYYPFPRPLLTFGLGVTAGSWLAYDCDWRRHTIWVGNRHRPWVAHDWRRPVVPIAPLHPPPTYRPAPDVRPWRPSPVHRPAAIASPRFRSEIARPSPIGIAPVNTRRPVPRPAVDRDRRPGPTALPVVPPLAPTFAPTPRGERTGPRAPAQLAMPAAPATLPRTRLPTLTPPNLQPLPTARQLERSANRPPATATPAPRSYSPRSRAFPSQREVGARPAPAALPSVPALRMAPGERMSPARATGPTAPRVHSRPQFPRAPTSTPAPATLAPATPPPSTPPAASPPGARGHRGGGYRYDRGDPPR
jgi:hypothetical protein